jgi:hypothetical protein
MDPAEHCAPLPPPAPLELFISHLHTDTAYPSHPPLPPPVLPLVRPSEGERPPGRSEFSCAESSFCPPLLRHLEFRGLRDAGHHNNDPRSNTSTLTTRQTWSVLTPRHAHPGPLRVTRSGRRRDARSACLPFCVFFLSLVPDSRGLQSVQCSVMYGRHRSALLLEACPSIACPPIAAGTLVLRGFACGAERDRMHDDPAACAVLPT